MNEEGKRLVGYMVVTLTEIVESQLLPEGILAEWAGLIPLNASTGVRKRKNAKYLHQF